MVSFSSALNFIPYDEFNNNFILEKKENKAKQKASEIPPNNYSTQESQMQHSKRDVCGAPALNYNFNQITCESCKAFFFRRNTLRHMIGFY
ncbi:unnamed protein product [Rotaria socialis]|uniref:Nuclear receptor domain-containing protein n=1 Tax=Rotaria socialis TaxID=392032 RepID=A0A817X367_9BILA|nr:unnamed protein product [Rotaria socialis]